MIATVIKKLNYNYYQCESGRAVFNQLLVQNSINHTYDLDIGDKVLILNDNNDMYIIGKIDNGNRSQKIKTQEHQYSYNIDENGITEGIVGGSPRKLMYKNIMEDIQYEASISPQPKSYQYRCMDSGQYIIKQTDSIMLGYSDKQIPNFPLSIYDVIQAQDFQQQIRNNKMNNYIKISKDIVDIYSKNIKTEQEGMEEKYNKQVMEIQSKNEKIQSLEQEIEEINSRISKLEQMIDDIKLSSESIEQNIDVLKLQGNNLIIDFKDIEFKSNNIKINQSYTDIDSNNINTSFSVLNMNNKINITNSQVSSSLRLMQNNDIIVNGEGILNSKPIARKGDRIIVYAGQIVTTPVGPGTVSSPGDGIISL